MDQGSHEVTIRGHLGLQQPKGNGGSIFTVFHSHGCQAVCQVKSAPWGVLWWGCLNALT